MSESERITTLGFLNINLPDWDEFTREMFLKLLPLSQLNMGIDLLSSKPLVRRKSRSLDLNRENTDEIIANELFTVTLIAIRWLKENNIVGNIVFCYKMRVQYWDCEIECAAFYAT